MIRSTFATLNLANRALTAQQIGMDITGHNIANANTDGFTRQAAVLEASTPFTMSGTTRPQQPGQLGTGADVVNVKRFRDGFVDLQFRQEQQLLGQWTTARDSMAKIEQALNEPSTEGLSGALSRFWNSWSALANNPESQASRKALAENAQTVANQMNQLHRTLTNQQRDLDRDITLRVDDINNLTTRIARLNDQVIRIVGAGDQPNDLKDERDLLIDQLSKLVNMTYVEGQNGGVTINIAGRTVVYNTQSFALRVDQRDQQGNADPDGFVNVFFADPVDQTRADPGSPVNITSGQLAGDLQVRDTTLQNLIDNLQSIGSTLIEKVNEVHGQGFGLNDSTGLPFFEGTGADDIAVSSDILADLDNIAAASSQLSPGDGSNALRIHDIQREALMQANSTTIEEFYAGQVANLGIQSQQAQGMARNEELLSGHLSETRQSIGGVSLDEETTNLIRYQHAYNAAARVVTAFDEMLDRVINNMGIVGR
jgi:flagellar hook-associated protein 1 FlgK